MNELDLRALVREAVERHLGGRTPTADEPPRPSPVSEAVSSHVSHGVYLTLINPGDACVIEPAVPCTHCNYCRSHGH